METKQWFVLRDLKRPNAKHPAWQTLPLSGFEVFTPMRKRTTVIDGKKLTVERPVLSDLLFVYSDRKSLEAEMELTSTLQFRFLKGAPYRTPMTVRNDEMQRFITAVRSTDEPEFFLPSELTADKIGRRVRVIGGPLAGYEGTLLKIRGSRRRRLLIALENYIVAAVELSQDLLQFL